ncbi:GNAT family N-acetyltransferase [Clostridium folliculivorans]|uniref:N-acetyltransferase n=1 Tax=Clostridium folliculivorans TaxID=2886038 RepID=A0A9W5Y287_9CLOT|nr:GNAT family N-acetyltransferase [Clostridium folliculivorans]GKU25271.1 N-acetyltransferase [Clostridium folliculivorans]GKU28292.1 N-acetyltransferase [Clostridium folliculivorans]
MDISLMTIDDYEKVYKLWTNTSGMGIRSLDDSFQGINKFIKRNPTTNFIAKAENEIVGVILCGHDGRRGYIYHTAVSSEYRGKGIGKVLVKAVLEALRQEEINKVALVAFASNDVGNRFWKSIGFEGRDDLVYRNLSINQNNN